MGSIAANLSIISVPPKARRWKIVLGLGEDDPKIPLGGGDPKIRNLNFLLIEHAINKTQT